MGKLDCSSLPCSGESIPPPPFGLRRAIFRRRRKIGGEGRDRAPNALVTAESGRFFRLIKRYTGTTQQYTFTTPLLALPLAVILLTVSLSKVETLIAWLAALRAFLINRLGCRDLSLPIR